MNLPDLIQKHLLKVSLWKALWIALWWALLGTQNIQDMLFTLSPSSSSSCDSQK